jgi:hypothetical protein
MTDDAPRIAVGLEWPRLLIAAILLIRVPLVWERKDAFGALFLLFALFMIFTAVRVLTTKVSAAGISQVTWRGPFMMRWEDVIAVDRRKRSTVLTSAAGSVVVSPESFYDTRDAVAYIDSHLPASLRHQSLSA